MAKLKDRLNLMAIPKGTLFRTADGVRGRAARKTDICDHLETLFYESLGMRCELIVELGSGDGESTFVLERAARLWKARLISVDIEDRREVGSYERRIFVQRDDVVFASEFPFWCERQSIRPKIDILFIDTSHLYEHTVREIQCWFPYLAPRAKVIFHDTNLTEDYNRKDGSRGAGWNNGRGVIRAVEEYFDGSFNEGEDFMVIKNRWLIRHYAHCNGLTILDRYDNP
jgi:hypothetical protein